MRVCVNPQRIIFWHSKQVGNIFEGFFFITACVYNHSTVAEGEQVCERIQRSIWPTFLWFSNTGPPLLWRIISRVMAWRGWENIALRIPSRYDDIPLSIQHGTPSLAGHSLNRWLTHTTPRCSFYMYRTQGSIGGLLQTLQAHLDRLARTRANICECLSRFVSKWMFVLSKWIVATQHH